MHLPIDIAALLAGSLVSPQVTGEVTGLPYLLRLGSLGAVEVQSDLQLQSQATFRDRHLSSALKGRLIELTIPDKPNTRLQKYRPTANGKPLSGNR